MIFGGCRGYGPFEAPKSFLEPLRALALKAIQPLRDNELKSLKKALKDFPRPVKALYKPLMAL